MGPQNGREKLDCQARGALATHDPHVEDPSAANVDRLYAGISWMRVGSGVGIVARRAPTVPVPRTPEMPNEV
jgi:hypothetical protein